MNEQDLELARSHSEYRMGGGDFCFMEEELEAFLAERDAIKHKELLQIHEVLQCIGCEHEASKDDTWTVKGVKQLAERVQKSEAALADAFNTIKAELGVWKYEKEYHQFKCSRIFVDMRIEALEKAVKQENKS